MKPFSLIEAQDAKGVWHTFVLDANSGHIRSATEPEVSMHTLLKRIREWDALNPSVDNGGDAPYWQREIARVIGER